MRLFRSCDFFVWFDFVIFFDEVSVVWLLSALVFVDFFVKYSVIGICARRSVEAVFKIFCV